MREREGRESERERERENEERERERESKGRAHFYKTLQPNLNLKENSCVCFNKAFIISINNQLIN